MLRVDKLCKRFGRQKAVDSVSFEIATGEVVGVLGPNGAGKTTTLRMLTGFIAPDDGRIELDGIDALADSVGARSRMGYMPEGVPLYREMRVCEYLNFRAALKGVPRSRRRAAADNAMRLADVEDVENRIIGQLSRGYRQRVGLADALVSDPPLLILDEPTAGLDPNQIRHVRALIRRLGGRKTVLLSTHILSEAEAICERVLILNQGRLVAEGRPDQLRKGEASLQQMVLEVRGKRAVVEPMLWSVEGVQRVMDVSELSYNNIVRARIEVSNDPQVSERVFEAASKAGVVLREMRSEGPSLEDVFSELTKTDVVSEEEAAAIARMDKPTKTSQKEEP